MAILFKWIGTQSDDLVLTRHKCRVNKKIEEQHTLATDSRSMTIETEVFSSASQPLMNVSPRLSTKAFMTSASPLLRRRSSKQSARASLCHRENK